MSFKSGVCLLQSSDFPVCKPCSSSVLDIPEACFPCAESPGLRAHYGSWILLSLSRTSAVVIILPFVGCLPRDVDLACTVSHPSVHLTVIPSLYLELWKIFSANLQVILINSCSVNTCHFGVPTWEDKLRVFLLSHFGYPYIYLFIFIMICFIYDCIFTKVYV